LVEPIKGEKMPDYKMIVQLFEPDYGADRFNEAVSSLLERGYELYGPPSVTSTTDDRGNSTITISQALYLP
jgi:hypothetical protein